MSQCIITRQVKQLTLQQLRYKTSKPVPDFGKTTYVYRNLPDREENPEFEENEFLPRRLSYWPPGLGQHKPRQIIKPWTKIRGRLTLIPPEEKNVPEYSETPNYPALNDHDSGDWDSHDRYKRLKWYDQIKNLPTVEQKISQVTKQTRLYNIMLGTCNRVYNNLPFTQNITRTNLIHGLPASYGTPNVNDQENPEDKNLNQEDKHLNQEDANLKQLVNDIKPFICDVINFHYHSCHVKQLARTRYVELIPRSLQAESLKMSNTVYDLANTAINFLVKSNPQLAKYQVDYNPDVRSWWFASDLDLPNYHPRYTGRHMKSVDQPIQCADTSVLNLRSSEPIPEIESINSELSQTTKYQVSSINPVRIGYPYKLNRFACTAGYWPNERKVLNLPDRNFNPIDGSHLLESSESKTITEPSQDEQIQNQENFDFPFLTFKSLHPLIHRQYMNPLMNVHLDQVDETESMGILSSFSWLNSLAMYHGFTPYQEITYPFVNQNILTDGQFWTFQVYQLNCHSFHSDLKQLGKSSNTRNICWTSGQLKLFEEIREDGKLQPSDLNDQVLTLLIKFLTRKTSMETLRDVTLKPYLDLSADSRSDKHVSNQRFFLRRQMAQCKKRQELYFTAKSRPLAWEHVWGFRNKYAPPSVHLRKPYKGIEYFKLPKDKFKHK